MTPTIDDLINQVNAALGVLPPNLDSASAGGDVYEAYMWSLVLTAARNEGAAIDFATNAGTVPALFVFRTSPSAIYSRAHPYCHANIRFAGCPDLEAHTGILVTGKSQVQHEADVAVVHRSEADTCRAKNVHPRARKVVIGVECKFYVNANIGIGLGRSYLGLVNDIYGGGRFFVGTKQSASVSKLLTNHGKNYELAVTPLEPARERRLIGAFETSFRDFKARHS